MPEVPICYFKYGHQTSQIYLLSPRNNYSCRAIFFLFPYIALPTAKVVEYNVFKKEEEKKKKKKENRVSETLPLATTFNFNDELIIGIDCPWKKTGKLQASVKDKLSFVGLGKDR